MRAPRGVGGQGGLHQGEDVVGNARQVVLPGGDPLAQFRGGAAAEGVAPGGRERHQGAPAEHVGGRVSGRPGVAFGRHPAGGPVGGALVVRAPGADDGGDAEVDDPGAVRGQDDVAGFDVAVRDPGGVQRGQALGGARRERAQHLPLQGAEGAHVGAQVPPGDVVEGEPGHAGGGVRGVQARGAHAPGAGQHVHLAGEGLAVAAPAREPGVHGLDGHAPPVAVESRVDGAHAARADPAHDPVGAEPSRVALLQGLETGREAGVAGRRGNGGGGGRDAHGVLLVRRGGGRRPPCTRGTRDRPGVFAPSVPRGLGQEGRTGPARTKGPGTARSRSSHPGRAGAAVERVPPVTVPGHGRDGISPPPPRAYSRSALVFLREGAGTVLRGPGPVPARRG